jgi:hypothetical protein
MGDSTGLIVIGALAVGAFLFKDQIATMIQGIAPSGGGDAGGDQGAQQQQPAEQPATATSTTNIYAPTPLGAYPYPVPVGYPIGYAPFGGWPYPYPPVIGHFSAPRWFNNWPRPGPWWGGGFPHPHPGPRFLGPPVPAPGPHH